MSVCTTNGGPCGGASATPVLSVQGYMVTTSTGANYIPFFENATPQTTRSGRVVWVCPYDLEVIRLGVMTRGGVDATFTLWNDTTGGSASGSIVASGARLLDYFTPGSPIAFSEGDRLAFQFNSFGGNPTTARAIVEYRPA